MPLKENGEVKMVVALQLSTDKIAKIMQQREGMGKTGESYLVGQDLLMRSDSFLDPLQRSIKASFAGDVENNGVDTIATRDALKGGENTQVIVDYNNNSVLSAYTSIDIKGVRWALIVEVDEVEAMAPVRTLEFMVYCILALTILGTAIFSMVITSSITRVLGGEPEQMRSIAEKIADGDLSVSFSENTEKTGVYGALNRMSINLLDIIGKISNITNELSSAAGQTNLTAEEANTSLLEQQYNIKSVSAAMLELSENIGEVTASAKLVANSTVALESMSKSANKQVEKTINQVKVLSSDIKEATEVVFKVEEDAQLIGSIIDVIRDIADQTNLLALNAAIEAARAGDQGRGFAVVADEVRQLAQKTQVSTLDIRNMIEQLQAGTQQAVAVMGNSTEHANKTVINAQSTADSISKSFKEAEIISQNSMQIAAAAAQQADSAQEVSKALELINHAATKNAAGVTQITGTSEHLNNLAIDLQHINKGFTLEKEMA
jgi:methyl-accepting chemotaxis protein